jgi:hypothetical protein
MEDIVANSKEVTYKEAGLTKEDVYTLVFTEMLKNPDGLNTKEIYDLVNNKLKEKSQILSDQGKATLRNFDINMQYWKGLFILMIRIIRIGD